jgi:DHA1 family tetracycline resistance protein-like MFS transporter
LTHTKPLSYQKILTPIGLGMAISLLGDATLYMVLPSPDISAIAGVTMVEVGFLLGLNRLVRVFSNGAAGYLLDRFNRRPLMIASLALGTLSTAIYALGYGFWILALGRIIWGVAWSGIWIGGNAAALDISNDSNRGRVNGRLQMWFFAGSALSSLAGGVLTDQIGFRGGLWISFGLMLAAVGIWVFSMPETKRGISTCKIAENTPPENRPTPFLWVFSITASIPIFFTRLIFAGIVSSTTILWVGQFFKQGVQSGSWLIPIATLTGAYSFLRVSIGILSAPVSGYLSDRFGRRWIVMALFLVAGAVGLYIMGSALFWLAILGSLMAAIASGCVQALVPAVIGDRVPEQQRARSLGVIYTTGDIGSAIGPTIGLGLIPLIGLPNTYALCALAYLTVSVYALWEIKRENQFYS